MKEGLGISPEMYAYLGSILILPWMIKPLYGLISDFCPLFGYRRKSYIYVCNTVSIIYWLALSGMAYKGLIVTYWPITIVSFLLAISFSMTDVVADGLMIQTGQETDETGKFQAIQWTSIRIAVAMTIIASAWLAIWAMPDTGRGTFEITQAIMNRIGFIFLFASIFPITNIVATFLLVKEKKMNFGVLNLLRGELKKEQKEKFQTIKSGIWEAVKMKKLWILGACIFFLHFSPGWGAPFHYYFRDYCGPGYTQIPKMTLAYLSAFGAAISALGCIVYWRMSEKINIRKILYASVILGAISSFSYLWVQDVKSAVIIYTMFDPIAAFIALAYLDLAAKNCPKMAEGFVFAAMMSLNNTGTSASSAVGGWFYGKFGVIDRYIDPWMMEAVKTKVESGYLDYFIRGEWNSWAWLYTEWLTNLGVSPYMVGLRPLIIISALFTLATVVFIPMLKLNDKGLMQYK